MNNPAVRVMFRLLITRKIFLFIAGLIAMWLATEPAHAQLLELNVKQIEQPPAGPVVFLNHPGQVVVIVRSSLTTLNFSSSMEILEQRNDPDSGEYRIVIRPENQILTVNAPGFISQGIPLRGLQSNDRFYYLVEPVAENTDGTLPVVFRVQPPDASLFINGEPASIIGTLQLSPGSHEVRIEREGYASIEETIVVSTDQILFEYRLDEIDIVPVRITSNVPGARVSIDGMDRGEIDSRGGLGLFLFPGSYSLSLTASGHIPVNRTIEIEETGSNSFGMELQPNIGTLRLSLDPADAHVEINRQVYTGQSEIELAPGRYRLEVSKDGYAPYSESVDVALNETLTREIVLQAYTGSLQFSVVPSDARVQLRNSNGEVAESWEGLNLLRSLNVGDYQLEIRAEGFRTQSLDVEIQQDETSRVQVELNPGIDSHMDTDVVDVYNPATGRTWMDRNLGASRAATSSTDSQAYGDLYQWGRDADGHQKRNSTTTYTLSSSNQPGHGSFILARNSPYDWRSTQNNNLWQGVNGINNPCPTSYRLPTVAEWEAEYRSWGRRNRNAVGAFTSPLKLPLSGNHSDGSNSLNFVGSVGYYWSGNVDFFRAWSLVFSSNSANNVSFNRALGFAVRCIKD